MDTRTIIKPEVIQYLVSSEFNDTVVKVGEKFNLNINQIGNLIAIIKNYVYGNIQKSELVGNIIESVEVDEETVIKMLPDINTAILEPLKTRILMSYNYEMGEGEKTDAEIPNLAKDPNTTQAPVAPVINNTPVNTATTPTQTPVKTIETPINSAPIVTPIANQTEHNLTVVESNLKESTVSTVKNTNYTVDPYREPLN